MIIFSNMLKKTRCILVTVDRGFVERLRAEGLIVITLGSAEKANIVDMKLREKLEE